MVYSIGDISSYSMAGWWCNNHLEKYENQWEGLSHVLCMYYGISGWWYASPSEKYESQLG